MSKNITRTPSVSSRRQEAERRRQEVRRRLMIAGAVVLALLVIAIAAFVLTQDDEPEAGTEMTGDRPLAAVDPAVRTDYYSCLSYTSPSPRDRTRSRMPSSA